MNEPADVTEEAKESAEVARATTDATENSTATASAQAPLSAATPGVTLCDVLIADDAGPSRQILSAILRNFAHGLRLAEARNGDEAFELWQRLQPRITMLDLDMPGTDGLATLQKIRAASGTAFVAIVSGRSSPDNVRRALELGASGFVVKPYKPQRILDLLERYARVSGQRIG